MATAYPPGEIPSGGGGSGVSPLTANACNTDIYEDKPPRVYVQKYQLAYNSQVGAYTVLRFTPAQENLIMHWTQYASDNTEIYDWLLGMGYPSDVVPGNEVAVWPADVSPPSLDGNATAFGTNDLGEVGPPLLPMEQCDVKGTGYFYNIDDSRVESATYNRAAKSVVMLFTGGIEGIEEKRIYELSVNLWARQFKWWFGGGDSLALSDIASGATAGVFGAVGSDHKAYAALSTGSDVEVSPQNKGVKNQGGELPGVNAWKLMSETLCDAPTNVHRLTIGIGEQVACFLSPLPPIPAREVTWTLTGGGSLSLTNGIGTTFTASMTPSSSSVVAHVGSVSQALDFTAIAPSGFSVSVMTNFGLGTVGTNTIGASTGYWVQLLPTNVSFAFIHMRENISSITNHWPNGSATFIAGKKSTWGFPPGECATRFDDLIAEPLRARGLLFNGTAYTSFSYTLNFTNEYQNQDGNWIPFAPVTTITSFGPDGCCQETYQDVPGSCQGPWQ